jgi:hypothetical protein
MKGRNIATLTGAGVGMVIFLAVGLLPAMVYGGYAGLALAGGIFGTPVGPSLAARGLVLFGMILGVLGVASLFSVAGAAAGAAVAEIWVRLVRAPEEEKPAQAQEPQKPQPPQA